MPTKLLDSQAGRGGVQKTFKFGGGKNMIAAESDIVSTYGYIINSGGGDDVIFGSDFTGRGIFDPLTADPQTQFGDLLIGGNGSDIVVGGLGNDTIFGGNEDGSDKGKGKGEVPTNTLIGDGGFDASDPANIVLIDWLTVAGAPDGVTGVSAPSFGDTITGGNGSTNDIYGDYVNVTLTGNATPADAPVYIGGSDTLNGGDNDGGLLIDGINLPQNNIYGDAEFLTLGENTDYTGGVDIISGGTNADNSLYGDAFDIDLQGGATFKGGNDVITGGDGSLAVNDLYGDAQNVNFNLLDGTAEGGNDRLVSGTNANDVMHGDFVQIRSLGAGTVIGGEDTFVFGSNNGSDRITDFEQGVDTVELSGIANVNNFGDLTDLWVESFVFTGNIALDFDGTVDGLGDIIIFQGFADESGFTTGDFAFV